MTRAMKEKGREILLAAAVGNYPEWNMLDYRISMMHNLNYYRANREDKEKQKWAIAYWKSLGLDVLGLDKLDAYWFGTVGAIAHMIHKRNLSIDKFDTDRLLLAREQLLQQTALQNAEKTVKEIATVKDRIVDLASKHIGEIEGVVDDFVANDAVFDIKEYLTKNEIKSPTAKVISDHFKKTLIEVRGAIDGNEELVEGYSHLGKRKCSKLYKFLDQMISDCADVAVTARTTRKPSVRKPQSPVKLVAKMKYLSTFDELKMKSVFPEKIVGASELWCYDTAKRRLYKYVAQDGMTLTVKGTTILNWDVSKSGNKIIRKPETLMKVELTKRPLSNLFNGIRATVGRCNGRTNDDLVILKAF